MAAITSIATHQLTRTFLQMHRWQAKSMLPAKQCSNKIPRTSYSYVKSLFEFPSSASEAINVGGEVLNVLFAALIGGFALGMAAPNIQHFVAGCAAFARLQKVLNRWQLQHWHAAPNQLPKC